MIGPNALDEATAARALASMAHRGPDGQGMHHARVGRGQVSLLHTRLAIIDPEPRSAQPFHHDSLTLIFNGEIYNYVELRAELESAGCQFRTDSDTEVLIQGYGYWGAAVLDRLEGMWALAIADPRRGGVFLARDRFGEKPLYLHGQANRLLFASEIKTLAALTSAPFMPNTKRLHRFIAQGYRSLFRDRETFFKDVSLFPAAHCAFVKPGEDWTPKPYWQPSLASKDMSWKEASERVEVEIDRAISIRLRADVPVAISLSGGVDSNVLAGRAVHDHSQNLHSFSMLEAERDYDESAAIRAATAALGTPHHEIRVSTDGFVDRLGRMAHIYDGPVPSLGMYLDGFLAESVAEAGFKVLMNGNGADEIFSGYYDHYLIWLATQCQEHPEAWNDLVRAWRQGMGRHVRNPMLQDPALFIDQPNFRDHLHLNAPDVARVLRDSPEATFREAQYCDDPLRNRMLNELMHETVPILTWSQDSHYMAHSIENRAAYLDRGLIDVMAQIPTRHLIHKGYTKALLRHAGRMRVPDQVLWQTQKLGFNAPILSLLDREDANIRERLLADSAYWDLVDRDTMARLLAPETPLDGQDNLLFCLISARLFYESHIDQMPA